MIQADKAKSPQVPKGATSERELCPQCGQPVYDCGCTKRWEDEGGAVLSNTEGQPSSAKQNTPGSGA